MAVANKEFELVGSGIKRRDFEDGRKIGKYIGLNEVTDASGDKTIAVPPGWKAIESLRVVADTLGTGGGLTEPIIDDSDWSVAYGGSGATTFHYIAIVSR